MRIFYGNLSKGSRVFHADGQTDMTKLIVFFEIMRTRLKICVISISLNVFNGVQGPCCALAYIVRLWVWYIRVRTVHRVLTMSAKQETVNEHSCLLSDCLCILYLSHTVCEWWTHGGICFPFNINGFSIGIQYYFKHIFFMLLMNTGVYPCVSVQS